MKTTTNQEIRQLKTIINRLESEMIYASNTAKSYEALWRISNDVVSDEQIKVVMAQFKSIYLALDRCTNQ